MPDQGPERQVAIDCRDLWMVFGDSSARRFNALSGTHTQRDELSAALIAEGFVPAVRDVSFQVAKSELFVIMGLSGSGKSTVIRCLSRIIEPTAGQVRIDGKDILSADAKSLIQLRRRTIGMVFQHFGLFPNMTVLENVAFPLRVQGIGVRERNARAEEVIHLVGLEGKEKNYPRELSGGQQQRVGIARSLADDPAIWFLDEPFSALDPLIRRQLQDEFLRLQSTLHKSITFITHDFGEALKIADRIAIMRDGSIVQIGTPAEIVLSPADDYVAEFGRDIPKGRLMAVEKLMLPVKDGHFASNGRSADRADFGSAPVLKAGMPIEQALIACARGIDMMPVTDGDGNIIGVLQADQLVRALGEVATAGTAAVTAAITETEAT